jgi:hypothetical protein
MQLVIAGDAKSQRKLKRTVDTIEFQRKLKPGVILYCSWGYDQTNIDFYLVVGMKNSTVTLQEIGSKRVEGSDDFMSDKCVADPSVLIKAPFKKVVRSPWIKMESYAFLHVWDGKAFYRSWYA